MIREINVSSNHRKDVEGSSGTKEVRSRVQGDVETDSELCPRTTGGIKLQRRYAREIPSMNDKGNSEVNEGIGTTGSLSTAAWIPVYKAGTTPDNMKEGGTPKRGPIQHD